MVHRRRGVDREPVKADAVDPRDGEADCLSVDLFTLHLYLKGGTMASSTKIELSVIHSNEDGFDVDLFAVDKLWIVNGEVDFAKRLFRIPSPQWLRNLVFKGQTWDIEEKPRG